MRGIADPNAFFLSGFTPGERTACAHEAFEDFRVMRRMQRDKSHSLPNAFDDAIDNDVGNLSVRDVSPPDDDVGFVQNFVG